LPDALRIGFFALDAARWRPNFFTHFPWRRAPALLQTGLIAEKMLRL
jgi:hypothetical protein